MKTLEILQTPELRAIYLDALLAGLPVTIMGGVLSVLAVVKRLGFAGQGISHSAFGGVGIAAMLLAVGLLPESEPWAAPAQFAVIVLFCLAASWGIGLLSHRRTLPVDTAIGVFLAGSMAGGAILVQVAREVANERGRVGLVQSWESILFGAIVGAGTADVALAWLVAAMVLVALWWHRRRLLFWAFDEESARAFGMPAVPVRLLAMSVLAVAIVTAMKLMGVILATALLALPGATALRVASRMTTVLLASTLVAVTGLIGGLVLSVETDWPAGPSIVVVLAAIFALACAVPRRLT